MHYLTFEIAQTTDAWPRSEITTLDTIRMYLACQVLDTPVLEAIYHVAKNTFGTADAGRK